MFNLKFKGKILLSILIPTIIIIGIIQYVSYSISGDIVIHEAEENMVEKAYDAKERIEQQILADQNYLQLIASTQTTQEALTINTDQSIDETVAIFQKIIEQNQQLETMLLINKDGNVIASDNRKFIGVPVNDRKYFQESISGNSYTSSGIKSKGTGNLVFIVSMPVKINDKIEGVIVSCNKMSHIAEEIINPIGMGKTGYALITDSEGVFLVHPREHLIMNKEILSKPNIVNAAKMGEGLHHYYWAVDDLDKIMQITKVSNNWYVAVTVPKHELLSVIDPIKYVSAAGALALIIVISIIIFFIIGTVAKILNALKDNINNLAQGITSEIQDHNKILKKAERRKDEFSEIALAARNIQKYLQDMSDIALKISQKDLTVSPEVRCKDDVLGNAMNTLIKEFGFAFHRVSTTVNQVTKGAQQLSSASISLSQGATEQAASIEEITASVATLGSQTKTNAENAASANNLAKNANKSAGIGKKQMEELSEAMSVITTRAEETQKVIKSIDDIAFQTNLLALNAAVEAARAGIHGKGFAVVAEEVRNLAARSAKAAGETAELIENVVQEINNGNSITSVTAKSFNEIVTDINKSSDIVAEIAAASNEQAEGVSQINVGLQQIEKVTQSNTANAEETASSSEEMSSMSMMLNQLVLEFKLKEEAGKYTSSNKKRKPGKRKQDKSLPQELKADIISPESQIKLDDNEFGKF